MKILFMGTPDFAVGAFDALRQAGHEIVAAVTQPDKAKGRSKELQFSPVKEYALRFQIPVLQPVKIKTPEAVAELRKYQADIFIVAAFGQILSQEILDIPKWGCLNIHASLLPKYRGASPIQHVILNGEKKTGITVMQMNAGLDTGDMLYKKEVEIELTDTFETLHNKLMEAGEEAIIETLKLLEAGTLTPEKQQEEQSCYAPLIQKEMGEISFAKTASSLELFVRGMNPWPSAYTFYKGKQMKIWQAKACDLEKVFEKEKQGSIVEITKDYIAVATSQGILKIYFLQLEGKKKMSTHDFLLGVKMQIGEKLGREA